MLASNSIESRRRSNPRDNYKMEELYNLLKLKKINSLKHNSVLLVEQTNSTDRSLYCFKMPAAEQELKLYKDCFPKVNQDNFRRLILPKAIKIGSLFSNDNWWLIMEYYGKDIIPWDEIHDSHAGGKSITLDYVDILIDMLRDLKTIDISLFADIIPTVDLCPWYANLIQKAQHLTSLGLFPINELQRVCEILSRGLSEEQKRQYILTNGDFQFRNFLKQPDGKIALIDWTENSYNTPNIEPIEFPIMYQWILMWFNPIWQNEYVKKAMEVFSLSEERLSFALVVKSINQADLWSHGGEKSGYYLSKIQIENCIRGLNGEIIRPNVIA